MALFFKAATLEETPASQQVPDNEFHMTSPYKWDNKMHWL